MNKKLKLRQLFTPKDAGLGFTYAVIAVIFATVVYSVIKPYTKTDYISYFLIQISFFAAALYIAKKSGANFFVALKLKKQISIKSLILSVLIGLTMMFALYLPSLFFVNILDKIGYTGIPSTLEFDTPLKIVLNIIFVALFPAICEEVIFRGVILSGLKKFGDKFAILVSSVFFMLIHQNPEQTLYPLLCGLVLGIVYVKTGNLLFTMLIHFLNNTMAILSEVIPLGTAPLFLGITPFMLIIIVAIIIFAVSLFFILKIKSEDNIADSNIKILILNRDYIQTLNNHEVPFLIKKYNFVYDHKKMCFYAENLADVPLEFTDVSENAYFNPYHTKKSEFWFYAVTGIMITVLLWVVTFVMGLIG